MQHLRRVDEFRGGGGDHRRGNQSPRQQGQQRRGQEEQTRVRFPPGLPPGFPGRFLRPPPGHQAGDDILPQGEKVVQRPVHRQPRRRIVQQHQEHQRHGVQLDFALQRRAPGIDGAGDQVDPGHQDGQHVDPQPADGQQPVRRAQVPNRPEGGAVQQLQPGQKLVGGDEEGNFQHQGQQPLQRVGLAVVVRPVEGLQGHEPLVPAEGLPDVRHAGGQPGLHLPLRVLNRVRPPVQRQHQQVDAQAQGDNRNPWIPESVHQGKQQLKQHLQRADHQVEKHGSQAHRIHPPSALKTAAIWFFYFTQPAKVYHIAPPGARRLVFSTGSGL